MVPTSHPVTPPSFGSSIPALDTGDIPAAMIGSLGITRDGGMKSRRAIDCFNIGSSTPIQFVRIGWELHWCITVIGTLRRAISSVAAK
jgi:hypothetical protein